mmetsp:Transcript_36270/g.104324  ORF Transcript_36270/g.104324 Transcript_36270/m.104324 type:complete len:224 (-) Transcript_36270:586-1257(-)
MTVASAAPSTSTTASACGSWPFASLAPSASTVTSACGSSPSALSASGSGSLSRNERKAASGPSRKARSRRSATVCRFANFRASGFTCCKARRASPCASSVRLCSSLAALNASAATNCCSCAFLNVCCAASSAAAAAAFAFSPSWDSLSKASARWVMTVCSCVKTIASKAPRSAGAFPAAVGSAASKDESMLLSTLFSSLTSLCAMSFAEAPSAPSTPSINGFK